MEQYDVVIISSSPAMMIEALVAKKQGKRVAIFDNKDLIGGAWYTKEILGYSNVEVGCHFINNRTETYQFLKESLRTNMVKMDPQPSSVLCGYQPHLAQGGALAKLTYGIRLLKYQAKKRFYPHTLYTCQQTEFMFSMRHAVRKGSIKGVFNAFKSALGYTNYLYYKRGCGELVRDLKAMLEKENVPVFLAHEVNHFEIDNGKGVGYCMANERKIAFSRLIISKHTELGEVKMGHDVLQIQKKNWYKKHYVFKVKGSFERHFTYLDVLDDDLIIRVSDVGIYVDKPDDILLLCLDITGDNDEGYQEQAFMDRVFARLKTLNLITKESELLEHYVEQFVSNYITQEDLKMLKASSNGVIDFLETAHLGVSVSLYKDRWKDVNAAALPA